MGKQSHDNYTTEDYKNWPEENENFMKFSIIFIKKTRNFNA